MALVQAFYRKKSVNLPLIAKEGFLTGFWSRNPITYQNMSPFTYQKSPKIQVGEIDEKRVTNTAQHGNEVVCTACFVARD